MTKNEKIDKLIEEAKDRTIETQLKFDFAQKEYTETKRNRFVQIIASLQADIKEDKKWIDFLIEQKENVNNAE